MYSQIEERFKKASNYYKGVWIVTGVIILGLAIYIGLGLSNNILPAIIVLGISLIIVFLVALVMRIKKQKIRDGDLILLKIILSDINADNKASIEQLLEHYRCYLPRSVYSSQFISWLALFVSILLPMINLKTVEEVVANLTIIFGFSVIFLIIYFVIIFYADYINRFFRKSGLYTHLESLLSEFLFNYEDEKINTELRLYNKYKKYANQYKKSITKMEGEDIYSLYEGRKINRFNFYEYINTIEIFCLLNKFGYDVNCNLENNIIFNEKLKIRTVYIDNTNLIIRTFFERKNKLINRIVDQVSLIVKSEKIDVLYINFPYKMTIKDQDIFILKINALLSNNYKNKLAMVMISSENVGNVNKQEDIYIFRNCKSRVKIDKNLYKLFTELTVKNNKVCLKKKLNAIKNDLNNKL